MSRESFSEEAQILRWIERGSALASKLRAWQHESDHAPFPDIPLRDHLLSLLEAFHDCVAYLEGRRVKAKTLEVTSEDAVQDLLFVMLKPVFSEFTFEDPSPKSAASYAIKDFYFPSMKLVLEAKYIGSRGDVKLVEKQLNDDIMKYAAHPDCEDLIFFIYDPHPYIADRRNFAARMSRGPGEFIDRGRPIRIQTIIKP